MSADSGAMQGNMQQVSRCAWNRGLGLCAGDAVAPVSALGEGSLSAYANWVKAGRKLQSELAQALRLPWAVLSAPDRIPMRPRTCSNSFLNWEAVHWVLRQEVNCPLQGAAERPACGVGWRDGPNGQKGGARWGRQARGLQRGRWAHNARRGFAREEGGLAARWALHERVVGAGGAS